MDRRCCAPRHREILFQPNYNLWCFIMLSSSKRAKTIDNSDSSESPFSSLPKPIDYHILSFLGPRDVRLARVNKQFNSFFTSDDQMKGYWQACFIRHFQSSYYAIPSIKRKNVNWRDRYKEESLKAYQNLTPRLQELFYLTKEGDYESLAQRDITYDELEIKADDGFFKFILNSSDQRIRDLFYNIIERHYLEFGWTTRNGNFDELILTPCRVLYFAVVLNQPEAVVSKWIELGADIHSLWAHNCNLLFYASYYDNPNNINVLVKAGVNPNIATTNSNSLYSPLHWAAEDGSSLTMQALIQGNANVHLVDKDGDTPLMLATNWGHLRCVMELLAAGSDVNHRNKKNSTALLKAVRWNSVEVTEVLVHADADPNAQDNGGMTPLRYAITKGHLDTLRVLLSARRINRNLYDVDGYTPLYLAATLGNLDAVILLKEAGADAKLPFTTSAEGLRRIYVFASEDVQQRLNEFINAQDDPDRIDVKPDDIAAILGFTSIAEYLQPKRMRLGI